MNDFSQANVSVQSSRLRKIEFYGLLSEFLSRCRPADPQRAIDRLQSILAIDVPWLPRLVKAWANRFPTNGFVVQSHVLAWMMKWPGRKRIWANQRSIQLSESQQEKLRSPSMGWCDCSQQSLPELCVLLGVESLRELDWLQLPHTRRDTLTDHYVRTMIPKRCIGVRWLEEPKPKLKKVQRLIARLILSTIPIHEAAHAYRVGRSIRTCVEQHLGKPLVVRMDLENFFGSIPLKRVASLFRRAGFSDHVALMLARLCVAPARLDNFADTHRSLRLQRLPQGAPTSPGIANAIAYSMDRRLESLSKRFGLEYTRYADDLIFSGHQMSVDRIDGFVTYVAVIASEEGFQVNHRKTRKQTAGQRHRVLGMVINEKANMPRQDYETLRAILYNCQRSDPETQNRSSESNFRAHLAGRIGYLRSLNPQRAEKLQRMFDSIVWH